MAAWPAGAQTRGDFVPVTDKMLQNPDPGDWLNWRRTPNGWAFSPLDQINKGNVAKLTQVWAHATGTGIQESTPLVYDGVMYVPNRGDYIQAFDARSGKLLWEYQRQFPEGVNGARGRALDFLYMLSIIGGAGTSLGLSTPMISAAFADFAGIERSFALDVSVVVACIAIFGTSAWLGIERGFKRMADAAMWIALLFLVFVLLAGPTLFILKMATNGIGLVLQNFLRMNTWTDPVRNAGFVENWTVFYWAWWIAYGPFVGLFVTRISRGRRLRDIILGMLSFGTLGAGIFFMVLGNYAMHLDLAGIVDVTGLMAKAGEAEAIAAVIGSLPFAKLALAVFTLVAVVLLATTYDSASYTLASVSTQRLEAGRNPARWNRLFWACALGIVPVTLMFVEGGIKVLLSATIVVSLPLLVVGVLLAVSLMRMLREDAAGPAR